MKVKLYALQRAPLFFFFLIFFQSFLFSQQVAKVIPYPASPDRVIGFLQFTPSDYGSQKHPLIIFLHGIGERGNGTTQINSVAANAIPKFCAAGASMRFTVAGVTSSFVVLSPQLSVQLGYWPTYYVKQMIAYAKANLQIDTNRIYVCGLSLGGGGIWRLITDTQNFDHTFDGTIAAAAPVCGTQEETDGNFCSTIGANHLPVWAFHSMDDGTVGVGATQHAQILANICGNFSPAMKFTYYQSGGHSGAWIHAYDTGHITVPVVVNGVVSSFTANPNLYEWFLSHTRATGNTPPVSNAGSAQTITLPTSTVTLTGNGSGTNGATISSYAWVKTSGPAAGSINNAGTASTTVTGLVQGSYTFTLTVTDNHGLTSSSSVTITVNAAIPVNQPPVSNAGSNVTLTLPANSTILNGSASTDPDGTISTYAWTKTSGPSSYTISNAGAVSTALSNLVQGIYVFTLKVTDNGGATASSTVTVTVNAAIPVNQPPVSNAGSNVTITLPTNSTILNGSASTDPDGTISSYAWTKTSGPSSYTISNAGAVSTALSNLVQGVYVFTLKVTDNGGATASSTVTITVNAAIPVNQPPVPNAGSNISITLPVNSTTLNGSASNDPDGTISTYVWTKASGPSSYTISNAGAATTALSNLVQGVYVFRLTVTDNGGATASSTVTVTVNAVPNQPPVSNAGSNITLTLPVNSTILNGSASTDPDGTISTYAWTKTGGPSSYTISNAGAATTAVSNLVQGIYIFTLKVTDNGGATASSTVTIAVNAAPNQPPVSNAGSNIGIALPTNYTTLNGSASTDPDGTISTYAWTKTSGPSTYTISNAGAATTALGNLVQGTYIFTLTVTDNGGATASSIVTVTVNAAPLPANQSPIANAGANITITLPANNTILDGSTSHDPDGTISTYAWTKTSGPSSYTISNAGAATTALTNLIQGVYVFALQVTDNGGAATSATVTITVNAAPPPPNQLPVANAGTNITITLPVNTTTLDGTGSVDPDGTIVAYAWSEANGPASYSIANAGAAATALNNLTEGVYAFTLQVTDNAGAIAYSTVTVTVNPAPNQLPVASAGADITITLPVNTTILDGTGSLDPDGTIFSYSWNKLSGPSAITIVNSNTASPEVIGLVQGQYVFELTVTDNDGAVATDQVTVTVNAQPNIAPVANAGKDTSIVLPATSVTLSGSNSADADGNITAYQWKEISGPSAAVILQPGAVTTAMDSLLQGDYVFELQVTDNAGAVSVADIKVTVVNNFRYSQFFKLYPNPAVSTINLQFIDDKTGKVGINAYDVNGRLVMSDVYSKDQTLLTKEINITRLKAGMYYLEIRHADGTKLIRPFVKQ